MKTLHFVLCTLLSLTVLSCVEKSKRLTREDVERLQEIVTKSAPKPEHSLDVVYEDKVKLLGYDLPQDHAVPGEPFKVTWYWKCERPLGDGWKLFTHVADASDVNRINADAMREIRRLYPPPEWKAGDYIEDTQEVTLPEDWNSPAAKLYVGFWLGPERLKITKGKQDGTNRALGLTIPVESPTTDEVPTLVARKVEKAPKVDGKLEDPAWQEATPTDSFKNTMTGKAATLQARARVAYDDEHLYVAFEVEDDFLRSRFKKKDEHLWREDSAEIMIDPDGDGKNYFEIQVSPRGTIFDTRYDTVRKPKPYGHVAWDSKARVGVDVSGKIDDEGPDKGYRVEMAIPWKALATGEPAPTTPPEAGSEWRMNFFALDAQPKSWQSGGWSPPKVPDFHTPTRFGRVSFQQQEPAEPAQATAAAALKKSARQKVKLSQSPEGDDDQTDKQTEEQPDKQTRKKPAQPTQEQAKKLSQ